MNSVASLQQPSGGAPPPPPPHRPIPVIPPAVKPRAASTAVTMKGPSSEKVKSGSGGNRPKPRPRNGSSSNVVVVGDTNTMNKTKEILNEAADAVAKSFAKQTQGINKGRKGIRQEIVIIYFEKHERMRNSAFPPQAALLPL
jgi:hypothetical protein